MSKYSRLSAAMVCTTFLISAASASAQQAIFSKERPDFDASGITAGGFKVKPTLDLEERYDDNIYSDNSNEIEDFITTISPAIELESNWNRHQLNAYANGEFVKYKDENSEDQDNYGVGADARFDILRETFITAGITYDELSEERGSPSAAANSVEPTEYSQTTGTIGFYRGLRKVSLSLDATATQLDYDDGSTSAGANIDNDDRDRDQYRTNARIGYEFLPDYEAFISGSLDKREYDDTSVNRDSDGYEITVGTAVNISGKARGEVFVGYMEQDYDSNTLNDIDGAAFGASLLWNPTQITSLNFGVIRSIEETAIANSSGYIATNYSADLEHELLRNVLLGTNISFSNNDYESTTANPREDNILSAGAEVRYLINRNTSAKIDYEYQDRDSNAANQDYTKNIVMIGLGVGF